MSKDPLLLPPDWTESCTRTSSPLMNWASACSSRTEFIPEAKVLRFEDGGWEASGTVRKPELSCREWIRNSGSHTEAPFSWLFHTCLPGQSLGSATSVSLPATASAPWGLVSTMGAPVAATRGKISLRPPCTFHHPAGPAALQYCWYPHSPTHPTRPPSPKLTLQWPHLLPPSQFFSAPSVHPPCSLSQAGQFPVMQCSSPAEQDRLSR